MQTFRYSFLAAAALLGALSAGAAQADNVRVPNSSEADVIVPNALTDGGPAHGRTIPGRTVAGHLMAPTGLVLQTGSAQGVQPPNATPCQVAQYGEAQPHVDVTSPRGVVPMSNEGAPR